MKFTLALLLSILSLTWHANAHALECGDTITADTTLTADLHCTSGGYALYVATPGVTIDFDFYTVSGAETMDGIRIANASDVTLVFGNLTGFRTGVNASQADQLTVSRMFMWGMDTAVIASDSRAVTLVGNTTHSLERWAFFLPAFRGSRSSLGGHTISGNRLDGRSTLIGVCGHANGGSIIRNNELYGGGVHLLDGASGNQVTGNVMEGRNTPDPGIALLGSRDNLVKENMLFQYGKGITLIPTYTGTCAVGPMPLPQVSDNRITGNNLIIGQTAILLGRGLRRIPLVFANHIQDNSITVFDLGLHLRGDAVANEASGNTFVNTLREVRDEGHANRFDAKSPYPYRPGQSRISVRPSTGAAPPAAGARKEVAGRSPPRGSGGNPPHRPSTQSRVAPRSLRQAL